MAKCGDASQYAVAEVARTPDSTARIIEGDEQIRVQVEEEIYTRKIHVAKCESTYHFLVPDVRSLVPPDTSAHEIIHAGRPVAAWVRDKCSELVLMEAQSPNVTVKYKFKRPVQFHIRDVVLPVNGCDLAISHTRRELESRSTS